MNWGVLLLHDNYDLCIKLLILYSAMKWIDLFDSYFLPFVLGLLFAAVKDLI